MARPMILAALAFLALGVSVPSAAASDPPNLDWRAITNAAQCPSGPLVVNVTWRGEGSALQTPIDPNSVLPVRYWAHADYTRQLKIWQVGATIFCALAGYEGQFSTIAGASPAVTDPDGIAAGITGTFERRYVGFIEGELNSDPDYPTHGYLGLFQEVWDGDPDTGPTGWFHWPNTYFLPSWSGAGTPTWGAVFHGGRNGTWITSCLGDRGDITD